jgi:uncharacterized protein Yka (UPF0111/DUF47 family)
VRVRSHPERFFEAFEGLSAHACTAAGLLRDLLANPARATEILARMADLAHEAEALREHVMQEAGAVVVTPLPREDVFEIALLLYGTVTMLTDAAGRAQNLHLDAPCEPAARLADVVVRSTGCIEASVKSFREKNWIDRRCADMEPLVHEGHAIYDSAVEALFAGAPDPVEVIRWKELYDLLEHAVKQCHSVENALSSIVLENRD